MVDGLKLTISGEELRALLLTRIRHHEERAERWAQEETRTPEVIMTQVTRWWSGPGANDVLRVGPALPHHPHEPGAR